MFGTTTSGHQITNYNNLITALVVQATGQQPDYGDVMVVAATNPGERLSIVINPKFGGADHKFQIEQAFEKIEGLGRPFHESQSLAWLVTGREAIDALEARLKQSFPQVEIVEPKTAVNETAFEALRETLGQLQPVTQR